MNELTLLLILILVIAIVIVLYNQSNKQLDTSHKYVAYKDDYQKDLEEKTAARDAMQAFLKEQKENLAKQEEILKQREEKAQKEKALFEETKKKQEEASNLWYYSERCRFVKKNINDLPVIIRDQLNEYFKQNSERVVAHMIKQGTYNPAYETPIEVFLFAVSEMMVDEAKARHANGEWNYYSHQYEGAKAKTQQKSANNYAEEQKRREQKQKEEEQKRQQERSHPAYKTSAQKKAEYCEILGISTTHTEAELKKAYRAMAKTYHYDLQHDKSIKQKAHAEAMSRKINEAHEYLIASFKKPVI